MDNTGGDLNKTFFKKHRSAKPEVDLSLANGQFRNLLDIFLENEEKENIDDEQSPMDDDNSLKDFAIYRDPGRHSTDYILYKPKFYADLIKKDVEEAREQWKRIPFKGEQFSDFDNFYQFSNLDYVFDNLDGIYGLISINNGRILGMNNTCNNANEIRKISARKGFGKLLFIIALSDMSPIMSSRNFISKGEYRHLVNLSKDVFYNKEKFNDERRLVKKDVSDCEIYGNKIVDRSYGVNKDLSWKIIPLINKHNAFLEQMKRYFEENGVDYILTRLKSYISDAGQAFYKEKKGDKYWYESFEED